MDLRDSLIKAQDDYIELLEEEIGELMPLAFSHGWKSKRIISGMDARIKITDLKACIDMEKRNE